MGIEHSSGSQTLCYINADKQEECFRNEFEMQNIFEMGFDIVQRDTISTALASEMLKHKTSDAHELAHHEVHPRHHEREYVELVP